MIPKAVRTIRPNTGSPTSGQPGCPRSVFSWRNQVAVVSVFLISALGQPSRAADEPVAGGTLTVGLATDTAIVDPSITGSSITALITRNVVDSLVGQAEDNRFTPWLAERWEVNSDNTVYTFHLRQSVTFSDGTPLDAAAVKFNFDRILDPKTTSSYAKSLLGPVDKVQALDDRTVVITYKQPFAPLLQGLSLPYLGIQSPTYLRAAASTTNSIVGSGPFLLETFTRGSGSRLVRRADYNWGPDYAAHKGPAYLETIVFKYLPEPSVRLGALSSGQVQAIDEVPPANFRSVQSDSRLRVVTRENPGVNRSFFLNTSKGPFADVRVRQAFQSAVDVPSAVKAAYFGSLKPADNILGTSTLYYDPTIASLWGFDLNKAARLLDAAGWAQRDADGIRTKDGVRLSVRFVYDSAASGASDLTLAQAIQFSVKKAGFDLQLDPVDAGGYTARTAANDYDIASFFYVRAEPDILRTVFHSAYIPPNGSNVTRVTSLDNKLTRAIGASGEERKRLYGEIQAEIVGQAYAVPLYIAAYQLGASKRLQGISWATNAKPNFYDAWLTP
ncbi:ABC transporter substrate-binding protein [Microvirga tunisiensis]|uniref:ABC transporter substrate-binding protein n=1 Tax=Microvirga tunisiensis TaxID=2108360 RepID=A0A5N7MP34_9HYPH|nr:ABC transporter substrate-binding protein [Microvirga tunisiensis]MPR07499.1 ABC transporter substrate-binding protein [Microvirga tunisiensis]MPR25766.1 ABC transporter substrate-binding protein [Microvirga tunisiensis]